MEFIINPKPITKENFLIFGDVITTDKLKSIEINSLNQLKYHRLS